MKEQLEKTGKVVINLKFDRNDNCLVTFNDSTKLNLINEVYFKYNLKLNDFITLSKYKEIKKLNQYTETLKEALKIVNRKNITFYELIEKLEHKGLFYYYDVCNYLKNKKLINDDEYIKDLFTYYSKLGYSLLKIKSKFENKKFDYRLINKFIENCNMNEYKNNVSLYYKKVLEKYLVKLSLNEAKDKLMAKLLSLGFSNEISTAIIEKISI